MKRRTLLQSLVALFTTPLLWRAVDTSVPILPASDDEERTLRAGVGWSAVDEETGIRIRFVKEWDSWNVDKAPNRIDVYSVQRLDPLPFDPDTITVISGGRGYILQRRMSYEEFRRQFPLDD